MTIHDEKTFVVGKIESEKKLLKVSDNITKFKLSTEIMKHPERSQSPGLNKITEENF